MLNTSETQKDLRFSRQGVANHPSTNMTSAQPPLDNALPRGRGDDRSPQDTKLQVVGRLGPELLYERYGMLENPFGVTPNPRYLYESQTHLKARSCLIAGIECGAGFQALIAPPGMGKTTTLFSILQLFEGVASTAFLFQIHGDSRDFLRSLLLDLGGDAHDSDLVRMQDAINQLLIREHRAGRRTIIVIDEAQNLDVSVLETVRLLSNLETRSEKLLQIILAGQPQLAQRLATPEVAQLYQRISIRTTLIPFDLEDTRNYIEHRLRIAGYLGPPLFTPEAVKLIWERSRGVPRDINTPCFNALLLARAVEQQQVDSEILQEVIADLDLDRVRFSTDTPASGTQGLQSDNTLQLGNAAADPPATLASSHKICEAAVPAEKAEPVDDIGVSAAFRVLPVLASPNCLTTAVGNLTQANEEAVGGPGAEVAATRIDVKRFSSTNVWLTITVATLTIVNLLLLINGSLGKRNVELPSFSGTKAPHQSETARISTQSLAQQTPGALVDLRNGNVVHPHMPSARQRPPDKAYTLIELQSNPNAQASAQPEVNLNRTNKPTEENPKVAAESEGAESATEPPVVATATAPPDVLMQSTPAVPAIRVSQGLTEGRRIHQVAPKYPQPAMQRGIQGSVVLQARIGKDGRVYDLKAVRGEPALVPAAIDAVRQWRYEPYKLNGEAVDMPTQLTINFKLY
jgi:TonB family protein